MKFDALGRLSVSSLRDLVASLRAGRLAVGWSLPVLERQFPGAGEALAELLNELGAAGLAPEQMALLVAANLAAREAASDPARVVELVLSGPPAPGVPTASTPAQMRALFEMAEAEVLVVGYAFWAAATLFEPLVARLRAQPGFRVRFAVNIMGPARQSAEQRLASFAADFRLNHWPWPELPAVYYDPRALLTGTEPASLHAKCVVIDRRQALVTSANFTTAAQERNIEAGLLVRHPPVAERLATYFDALIANGDLRPVVWDGAAP